MAKENIQLKGFLVWYSKSKKTIQLNKDKLKEIREFLEVNQQCQNTN